MLRRSLVRSALFVVPLLALASCTTKTAQRVLLSGGVPIEVTTGYLDTTTSPPTFVVSAEVKVGQQLALKVKGDPAFSANEVLELRYSLTDSVKAPPSAFTIAAGDLLEGGTFVVIPIGEIHAKLPYGRSELQVAVHTRRQARVDTKDRVRNVGEGASVAIVAP